tara:strand:+ start:241 stop:546 length:306 start_codon:yes stop_codon:yes gene_type:complete
MTIAEKLNEIEEKARTLATEAQALEENKKAYEGLLECEIRDHQWKLEAVVSNLRYVQTIEIHCVRCGCYAMFARTTPTTHGIPVNTPSDIPLVSLIPEEDE